MNQPLLFTRRGVKYVVVTMTSDVDTLERHGWTHLAIVRRPNGRKEQHAFLHIRDGKVMLASDPW